MYNDNTADTPSSLQTERDSNTPVHASAPQIHSPDFIPLGQLNSNLYSAKQFLIYFQFYICAAAIGNLGLLFWDGSSGDISFWEDWVKQLANRGYKDFNGNYPPLYIHWLYIVGKVYNYLQLPIENNLFLKYTSLVPIFLSHFLLIAIVHQVLKKYSESIHHYHSCMVLTALNPALFMNGPIWGQVDILPVIPVLLAILASTSNKYRALTFPIYTIALLTKFQMIAFTPVMGLIFFRHYKIHLIGCLIAIPTIALLFLPSIVVGGFIQSFKLAYIDVLHQYGATTMGAANIWILLTGNAAPDTILLFAIEPNSPLATIFKAKNFGILSFFLVCLLVFLHGIIQWIGQKLPEHNPQNAGQLFFYALVCTMAFFALLPAMHERYLLPAVIVSLIYYALNPRKIIYPLAFSFISAFNVAMCLGIKTNHVWPAIAWIMMGAFTYTLIELVLGKYWNHLTHKFFSWFFGIKHIALLVLVVGFYLIGYRLYQETNPINPALATNQILLTDLPIAFSKQDYGQLNIHRNLNGNPLRADNRRYAKGLGTHANSVIEYDIPVQSKELSLGVALDDDVESASVKFSVWGDDQLLWESSNHYGAEAPEFVKINLTSVNRLRLQVDGINDISGDHANWLNPIITLAVQDTPEH